MFLRNQPPLARWGTSFALLLLAGCSAGGGQLTLFPQGHRLIDSAKALRAAYPEPAPLPRELDKRVANLYTTEPGDVLLVQPASLESPVRLPGDQPILPDGTINLGRYGLLQVAGKTVPEIEGDVQRLIEAHTKNPGPMTVRVVSRVSKVYYVFGEVNAPGAFVLSGRETVLDGIVTAGGLTQKATRKNIILVRPTHAHSCRIVLPICYNEIVQVGDTSTNYQLCAGDRIYVPTRGICEDLPWKRKTECAPCGGPQSPCPLGCGDGHGVGDMTTPYAPALPPGVPVAPEGTAPGVLPTAPPAAGTPALLEAPRR